MSKIFILAGVAQANKCLSKAEQWVSEKNQNVFGEKNSVEAAAEYLANEKGFTLYKENATYPKTE